MAFDIDDPETERVVRVPAERLGVSPEEAIRRAVASGLRREDETASFRERIRLIQEHIASYPPAGLEAGKAFYDDISGDSRCSPMHRASPRTARATGI